ncbi:MAG: DNA internalization-related competence protein ComEC/Rec2 [Bacillota bacterium]
MKLGIVLPVLSLFALGIALGVITKMPISLFLMVGFLLLALFIILRVREQKAAFMAVLLTFFLLGWFVGAATINYQSELEAYVNEKVVLDGMVSGVVQYDNRVVYTITNPIINHGSTNVTISNSISNRERVQLTVYNAKEVYGYGTIIKAQGVLKSPPTKRNPGGFDYAAYLQRKGIYTTLNVSQEQVLKLDEGVGNPILFAAHALRHRLLRLSEPLDAKGKGVFRAIVLGDKSGLAPEDRQIYQGLGIMHIFAVSGLHVGFLMILLVAATNVLRLPRRAATTFILCSLFLYSAVVGFSSPVLRASIMLGLYWLGRENWNDTLTANALCVAALVLLLLNPLQLFDASFQFSFAATAFIIFIAPLIKNIKYLRMTAIAVPLAAWAGTLPLTAFYFNQAAPLGILLAVPAGFLAGAVVILGFVALAVDFIFPFMSSLISIFLGGLIFYADKVMNLLHMVPFAGEGFLVATPAVFSVMAYYALFLTAALAYYYRNHPGFRLGILRWGRQTAIFLGILVILLLGFNLFAPSSLEVVFLDVGQGDCIFIKTPEGKTILIDGGGVTGEYNLGDLVVVPFLKHKGIRKVDLMINTHPHTDHLAGLFPVAIRFPVSLALIPPQFEAEYAGFMKTLEERGIKLEYGIKGQGVSISPAVSLNILHPPRDYPYRLGPNNHSLVTDLLHKDIKFLFTGDIEVEAIETLNSIIGHYTVLKFPHHGSAGSFNISFLEQIKPEVVIIQVGANNTFGHPGPEVIDYFAKQGIPVYRNDLHGAITIKSDGRKINIDTIF